MFWFGDGTWEGTMLRGESCLLADLPVILGGPIGLLALGTHTGSRMLCKCHNLMLQGVDEAGFLDLWMRQSYLDVFLAMALWAAAVASRWFVANAFFEEGETLYPCAFALSSGMFMALCLCTLHVCNCLTALVHAYSSRACAERQSFLQGHSVLDTSSFVNRWNAIQATIRKGSGAMECLMACLQADMLLILVLGAIDSLHGRPSLEHLASLLPLLALVLFSFWRAAAVTETCTKVPPLINSHVSESGVDSECQYVVRYIMDSAAGFYVFDVHVTTARVLKLMYFCGAFVLAVGTKLFALQ